MVKAELFSHSLRIEELLAILIWPLNCDQFIRIVPLYISLTVGGVCAPLASCVNSTMQFLSVAAAIRNLTRLLCCRGNEVIYNQIWSIFGPAMPYFALTGFTFVAVQLEYGCKIHKSQSFLPLRTILADIFSFKSLVQWQQRVTSLFFFFACGGKRKFMADITFSRSLF